MSVEVLRKFGKRVPRPSVALVLLDVNKVRKQEGRGPLQRLPRGVPARYRECPIARALRRPTMFGPTQRIDNFIDHFDRGHYPELISGAPKRKKKQQAEQK